ncbi:hypothetical protein U0C82_16270 [Fulvimarina sp. 2208YS6-2-32]|uniref:Uncharacterized protein n=1 Tax=Fulvimarina uroteuthidis TaxID=3098149 RepID=A0ABU5I5P8_9HYPH|nr:hypothetical protein [Fulvimarina sp. 2208YS6-2-32]MDY8110699.1 hypothetical protein [Fulvimarina sp. 2208YS6-2-32]
METETADTLEPIEIIKEKRHSSFWRWRIARQVEKAIADPAAARARVQAYAASLSGRLPGEDAGAVILAACDERYLKAFARPLLLSLERQNEPQAVHLHLCKPSKASLDRLADLAAALSNVRLTWTIDGCDLARGLPFRTVYLAAARFLVASLVIERTRAPLLCIDIDTIANRPVWPTFDAAREGADIVVIQRRDETSDTRRVRAGAFGINPTPDGLGFAQALSASIAAILPKRPRYHLDQIVIFYLMTRLAKRGNLKIADMPSALSSFDFDEDAVFWMAKGWKMKNSSIFQDASAQADSTFPDI